MGAVLQLHFLKKQWEYRASEADAVCFDASKRAQKRKSREEHYAYRT
jgi:hypothetical protein